MPTESISRKLHLSPDLKLPLDAVTSTFVIYGGKGMGKSMLAAVLCEELAACSLRFSLLDPLGVSWGLQSSSNGKGAGIEVLVLGGIHGDIPIDPRAGAVVADLVVEESVNVVIDISRDTSGKMWSNADAIRFTADYCTRLYQRQGEKRIPLMQIFDEAGHFVPQMIPHGSPDLSRCVGAIEKLVAWGRNVGVGVTLITQRSARMNKSVSELADAMFAFRTVGPNSIAAIDDWLSNHHGKARRNEILETIRSLPVGSAMLISPGWLGIEKVVPIRMRHTFDSSATPKPGQRQARPSQRAKIDLSKYRSRMQETIARAVADDPTTLKKKIAEMEVKLRAASVSEAPKPLPVKALKPMPVAGDLNRFEQALKRLESASQNLQQRFSIAAKLAQELAKKMTAPHEQELHLHSLTSQPRPQPMPKAVQTIKTLDRGVHEVHLRPGARKMLQCLAQYYPDGLSDTSLRTLACIKKTSSFNTYKGDLKRGGYAEIGEINHATAKGLIYLDGDIPTKAVTTEELLAQWSKVFRAGAQKMLAEIVAAYPRAVAFEAFEAHGLNMASIKTYASELRSNGLVEIGNSQIIASASLFPH